MTEASAELGSNTRFQSLLQKVHQGDDDAFEELIRVYGPYIQRRTRGRIGRNLRARISQEDVQQSVYRALWMQRSQILQFEAESEFIKFVVALTGKKLADTARKNQRQVRDVRRQVPYIPQLDDFNTSFLTHAPPSRDMRMSEWLAQLVEGEPPIYLEVLQLLAAGMTAVEIANVKNINERTVRRIREKARKRALRLVYLESLEDELRDADG